MKVFYTVSFYSLLVLVVILPCTLNAQDARSLPVVVNVSEKTLRQIFQSLEVQTGLSFHYDRASFNTEQKITLSFTGTLSDVLYKLSSVSGLEFQITKENVTVRAGDSSEKLVLISGRVNVKEDHTTLPGVVVRVKGTSRAASSNAKGEFAIRLPEKEATNAIVEFRYIGMKPVEVKLGNQTQLIVEMEQAEQTMDEVVVTSAYEGERRREEVVGSIGKVTGKQLQVNRPIESLDKMLQGMVAGVQVETSTTLNTPVKINIRGQGSLNSFGVSRSTSTQPLFVVDGVPMYEQQRGDESSEFSGETYLNPLSGINPQDIASISILKDAAASAIYGANAANGVVIITTKRGQKGRTRFNVGYQTGVSTFLNEMKYLSGPQYYTLLREMYINDGKTEKLATTLAGSSTIDTDWFDLLTRNGTYQNINFDASGGKDNTSFRFSGAYTNQTASSLGNDLKKILFRFIVDHEVSSRLKIGLNVSPSITRQNTLSVYGSVLLPPNISPYTEDGSYNDLSGYRIANPIAVLNQNEDSHKGEALTGSFFASYQLTKAIRLSGTLGTDYYKNQETQYKSALNATGSTNNGSLLIYNRNKLSWIGFGQISYDKTFYDLHTISILAGMQAQDEKTNLLRGYGSNFTFDRLRTLSQAGTTTSASSESSFATVSYYAQMGYNFGKKYYLNLNIRSDRSSIFGGDKNMAVNSSVGLGWIVTQEKFLPATRVLSFLRVRTSLGTTGNSRIGTYAARGLYTFGSGYTYNGNAVSVPSSSAAPNPDLSWETNLKLNVGVDITLLNRINITGEYYRNTIYDLIASVNVPLETGYNTISANSGTMVNQGVELTVSGDIVSKASFGWNTRLTFGFNRNEITRFNKGFKDLYSFSTSAMALREGISSGAIWGWQWAGINTETGAEEFYDKEGNKVSASYVNNQLSLADATVLGDRLPRFEGGFINTFRYRQLSLSVNLLYSYGASFLASYIEEADGRNLDHRNQSINLMDRWQKPGDVTTVSQLHLQRSLVSNSSRYVHDMTYLKLANVTLSYQLPSAWMQKLRITQASLFGNATNLLYWYREKSPKDRNGAAELRFEYPEMRIFSGGLTIGF